MPVDVLPSEAVAFFWAHPCVEENDRNIVQQRQCSGQILRLFCWANNSLTPVLTAKKLNFRRRIEYTPFHRKTQHAPQGPKTAIHRTDLKAITLPLGSVLSYDLWTDSV